MSGVLARRRNLSRFEYFNTAIQVRVRVTKLVHSANVPKSWRFTFAVPMAETARDVVFNLVRADAFYPNSEHNVEQRRHYMTLAVADCVQLLQDLQCLKACCSQVSGNALADLVSLIDRDIELIRGARKGVKLVGKG